VDVLRLAFVPKSVTADSRPLRLRRDLRDNGYTVKRLPNGDAIVHIWHDGAERIAVIGDDPQQVIEASQLRADGDWQAQPDGSRVTETAGAAFTVTFDGNQVRVIGRMDEFGGLADVYLDGQKALVHIDCWNPTAREKQVLYYKNGLSPGKHTLRIVARGTGNPYSKGRRVSVHHVQFSAAEGKHHFSSGAGPIETQRMLFGYTGREDYRDSRGNRWRPGTEFVIRLGAHKDSVVESWWTTPVQEPIAGTRDPELYRYGIHGKIFWVNVTVNPTKLYDVRLKFAARSGMEGNRFHISINDEQVVTDFDVAKAAGGINRAKDLFFKNITPVQGLIRIQFTGAQVAEGENARQLEAFVQAIELRASKRRQRLGSPPLEEVTCQRSSNFYPFRSSKNYPSFRVHFITLLA